MSASLYVVTFNLGVEVYFTCLLCTLLILCVYVYFLYTAVCVTDKQTHARCTGTAITVRKTGDTEPRIKVTIQKDATHQAHTHTQHIRHTHTHTYIHLDKARSLLLFPTFAASSCCLLPRPRRRADVLVIREHFDQMSISNLECCCMCVLYACLMRVCVCVS